MKIKDYTTMAFAEALTLTNEEFEEWCKLNPIKLKNAKEEMAGEVKGELDESN